MKKQNKINTTKLSRMTPLDTIEYLGECGAYDEQASEFLRVTGSSIEVSYKETAPYFGDDKEPRDVYNVTLRRGDRSYSFTYGDSLKNTWQRFAGFADPYEKRRDDKETFKINYAPTETARAIMRKWNSHNETLRGTAYNSFKPSAYSILAGMQTCDVGTFEDFITYFGYEITSKKSYENAQSTYTAVIEQYHKLQTLYNDAEMWALGSIS